MWIILLDICTPENDAYFCKYLEPQLHIIIQKKSGGEL